MDVAQSLAELQVLSENFVKRHTQNLSDNEFKIMTIIKAYDECSPKILVAKVGILKTNLAHVLKKLIAEGLVCSREHVQDLRSKMYALTEAGEQMLAKIHEGIRRGLFGLVTEDLFYALQITLSVLNKKL